MKKKENSNQDNHRPIYPLRSVSKLNYIPESMFPNAKSLVQTGYFVTTNVISERKRTSLGLPERKESKKHINLLFKDKYLTKLVDEGNET